MAIKTLRVFQEFTSAGYIPMPVAGNIDYGVTIAGTFPGTTPTTFQTDDPDIDVTLTATTDYYVWIRSHGTDWNPMYTRNVRVYPDSPLINNVVMGIIIANLSSTVPYTGATANVNLGEYGLTAGYLGLDLTPTGTPTTVGTMSWNDADGTIDLKLKGGNVTLQVGQEQVTRIVNKTGVNLLEANYQAVRISGAQGNRLKVDLAQANIDANSADTLGLVTETINNNQEGFITTSGLVRAIDTTGTLQGEVWNDGDILYLSGSVAGQITNIKPQAPTHTVIMGYVVRAHQTQGQIYVKVDNGYELDELHNVKITSVANKNTLVYDTATLVWKNRNIFGTQGYIPYYDDTLLMKDSIIYTNGTNVGIGSTTLTEKLVVNGNILATQFKKVGGLSTEFLKADGSSDATAYQPLSADLTAIDNLALTTGLLRKNGTDTWELDQTEYLSVPNAISTYQRIDNLQANLTASATKYPSVNAVNSGLALKLNLTGGTLTGGLTLNYSYPTIALSDVSSGTTWNITNDGGAFKLNYGATNKFYIFSNGNAEFINNLTASSLIKAGGTSTQFLKADGSVDSTTYQPYDADLSAIGALALTTGLLRKNGANTWELDQTEYVALSTLIANYQTIANLSSNLTASATKYPSVNAVNTGLNLKLNLSGGTMSGDLALSYSIPTIQLSDTSSGTIWNIQNDGGGFEINSGITNKFVMLSSGNATFVNDLTANKFIKSGGTSAQFLMADGSVSSGVSGGITGTLTTNYIPKSSGTNTITDSVIQEVSGIIGIGSTPSGWDYSGTIQLPSGGIFATRGSVNMLIAGALYNSGWKYNSPGLASMFEQDSGGFKWYTATSGSGGAALTWLQKMNLNPSGRLLINQTTDDGVNLIQANGSIISTGFKKSGGTSSQFLKADGSVDSSAYITRTSISATSPISYDNSLGVISIQQASGTTSGYLSNTDWTTFNGKQSALNGTGFVKIVGTTISYDNSTYYLASNPSAYISGITSLMVTNALGYTPYNATNPSGYISGNQTITLSGDVSGSGATAITTTLATITQGATGSFVKITLDTKGRVTGNVAVGSSDITSALGYTPYNSTNPSGYISGITSLMVTNALGYTPYNATNPSGYISGITSGMVTTALGYTPVTNARQLTINGTTYDLSADRSWTISGTIGGLTSGYIPKATSASTLGNSLIYDNGTNVGIGTTSPVSLLNLNNGDIWTNVSTTLRGLQFGFAGPSHGSYRAAIMGGAESYGSSDSGMLTFHTQNGYVVSSIPPERMRLTSGGNLLVGTTTDSGDKVNISGTFRSTALWTTSGGITQWGYGGTAYGALTWDTGYATIYATSGNVLNFGANGSSAKMTLNSSGNLGLGVTPSAWGTGYTAIQNKSTSWFATSSRDANFGTNVFVNSGGNYAYIETATSSLYTQYNGVHSWYTAPSGTAGTAISFTQAMTLDSSGRLLIGSTYSTNGLLVINSTASNGVRFALESSGTMNGIVAIGSNAISGLSTTDMALWTRGVMAFETGASGEKMRITTGGNLLVGTTTDSGYKLDVNGTGRFSGDLSIIKSSPNINLNASAGTSAQYNINNSSGTLHWAMYSTIGGGGVQGNWQLYSAGKTGGAGNVIDITPAGASTFSSSITASSFFESSDRTIKTLLIDNYQTKGIESITAKLYTKHGKEELGYFAQDVQGILPSAVSMGTNGLLNLSYREVLVAKVQSLEQRVLELETQLNLR